MSQTNGRSSRLFQPMQTAGTHHFIERTYRESGIFQWVRESLVNAIDAGATQIEFGIEWQAVQEKGVYRRTIADNGQGMSSTELVEFFNTFGGGGKPIGGAHENFGVGSKTSLLPWNHHGLVVVSWQDGESAMIWVHRNPSTGEYGLQVFETSDADGELALESVVYPFPDEDHGCDWNLVRPDFIEEHGTVLILLGNSPRTHTVLGDPNKNETDIKGISSFLNRRFWDFEDGVHVTVDELRTEKREDWPENLTMATTIPKDGEADRRTNRRTILGSRYFIEYPNPNFKPGKLEAHGMVELPDQTKIEWFLWKGDRPYVHSYAAKSGYIGALYRGELYDITTHHSSYRSFGISEGKLRQNLWLIAHPKEYEDGKRGVYPRTDRNALLLKGGPAAGGPLPFSDWAGDFADAMPQEIVDAIAEARGNVEGTIEDELWRERLKERFGSRWKVPKLCVDPKGGLTATLIQPAGASRQGRIHLDDSGGPGGGSGGTGGKLLTLGEQPGPRPATQRMVAGGIPHYLIVGADSLEDGMIAAWQPHHPEYPEGVVLINRDHTVLQEQIRHWQGQFADYHAEQIEQDVLHAYGQIAVARVAHSEHLSSLLSRKKIEDDLRSPGALTMSLLGLLAEEAVIAPRLRGKFRKKREAA